MLFLPALKAVNPGPSGPHLPPCCRHTLATWEGSTLMALSFRHAHSRVAAPDPELFLVTSPLSSKAIGSWGERIGGSQVGAASTEQSPGGPRYTGGDPCSGGTYRLVQETDRRIAHLIPWYCAIGLLLEPGCTLAASPTLVPKPHPDSSNVPDLPQLSRSSCPPATLCGTQHPVRVSSASIPSLRWGFFWALPKVRGLRSV